MTHTPDTLKAWQSALGLSESGMAAYIGVPVHTWRKWCNGTRKPDAAPCALLDLLTLLPDAAPALHTERLESAHGASKPDQATQASPSRKKSTAVPSTVDTSVNLASIMLEVGRGLACTRITPEEYAAIKSSATAQVLPDWMKTKA